MERKIIIDVMVLGLILCSFIAGLLTGQKIEFEANYVFYNEFIENECSCETDINVIGNKLIWTKTKYNPFNWSLKVD